MRELCVLVLCFKETQTEHTILDGGGGEDAKEH